MNLEAVAHYLESKKLGRQGETLFVTEMPMEAATGILLMDTYSGSKIDHELPGWRETGFRLVVRHGTYSEGKKLAERASDALTTQKTLVMGTAKTGQIEMRLCLPVNDPKPYRTSEAGTWEFEVDVECTYLKL